MTPSILLTQLSLACLFSIGWLEPLLDEIHKDYTIVVTPVIDVIDDNTLQYHYGSAKSTSIGGFDWNLQFNWHAIPARENQRRANDVSCILAQCHFIFPSAIVIIVSCTSLLPHTVFKP